MYKYKQFFSAIVIHKYCLNYFSGCYFFSKNSIVSIMQKFMCLFLWVGLFNDIIKINMNTFIHRYKNNWTQILNWSGRTSCNDFWTFALITTFLLVYVIYMGSWFSGLLTLILFTIALVGGSAALLAILSASIRRMNDINKPRYYVLIPFYNIILLFKDGSNEITDQVENNVGIEENDKFKPKYIGVIFLSSILLFIFFCVFTYLSQETDYIPYVHLYFERALFIVLLDVVLIPVHFCLSLVLSLIAKSRMKHMSIKTVVYACSVSFLITVIIYHILILMQQGVI